MKVRVNQATPRVGRVMRVDGAGKPVIDTTTKRITYDEVNVMSLQCFPLERKLGEPMEQITFHGTQFNGYEKGDVLEVEITKLDKKDFPETPSPRALFDERRASREAARESARKKKKPPKTK